MCKYRFATDSYSNSLLQYSFLSLTKSFECRIATLCGGMRIVKTFRECFIHFSFFFYSSYEETSEKFWVRHFSNQQILCQSLLALTVRFYLVMRVNLNTLGKSVLEVIARSCESVCYLQNSEDSEFDASVRLDESKKESFDRLWNDWDRFSVLSQHIRQRFFSRFFPDLKW